MTDPGGATPARAIRLARSARRRLQLEPPVLEASGALDARDTAAARRVAARLNRERAVAAGADLGAPGAPATAAPAPAGATPPTAGAAVTGPSAGPQVGAGDLVALAALGAVLHRVIEREAEAAAIDVAAASDRAKATLGGAAGAVERAWASEFGAADPATMPADLLVIATLNEDPAVAPLRELVDDRPLRQSTEYGRFVASLEQELAAAGPATPVRAGTRRGRRGGPGGAGAAGGASLPDRLREPMRHAPESLQAQLRWIREHWSAILEDDPALAARVALALDVIAEEHRALELAAAAAARATAFGGPMPAEAPDYRGLDAEPEAFSIDTDWMPSVVLLAKATYVWLEQLAARFGRPVPTLADVPDEELDRLAAIGVTGLWLIGVWQRSAASAEIKRRRGDVDAVASAYSVDDYRIADDLGGEAAFEALRARAMDRGIRIAADMVPNHMGLDSRWVVEHPEWFIAVPEPPFPGYTFGGPNLSPDPGVEITIEDHYWDSSDAAVVFRRRDTDPARGDDVRYVYHGNDGTSFPWNDTAQLDYLNPAVREAVIGTILDVARRAPIIRFDAAMVLARRHIRRLWYPAPGAGGAIPSRAEHAMSDAEFNRRMPKEFWREVVDRVAVEAPGTLLLAEAFWLLEGYFVRTLGMHRVYNSAFMHMLRDEDNAGYRKVMQDTLEFDPRVLQRFVNFMTNPDERPAAEQYGTGDKAFAAATLLATLPGLPMLGHGQVEGYRERYGHEFRRARWDEPVDGAHLEHFERTIVPLLRRRAEFSGADRFRLYDAIDAGGAILQDVYAFSNAHGGRHTLVLVHHHEGDVDVTIDRSTPARRSGGGGPLTRTRLADDLGIPADDTPVRLRDGRTGWQTTRSARELRERGLQVHLGPYEAVVLDVEVAPADTAPAEVTPASEAGTPPSGPGAVDTLPEPARTASARFLAALREVLGDDLVAAWVHGGTTFADRPLVPGDLDVAVVVRDVRPGERSPRAWRRDPASRPARIAATVGSIAAEVGVAIDATFLLEGEIGGNGRPAGAFQAGRPESAWAVMRAHWLAGQHVPLAGPPPEQLVGPPTARALRHDLERELEHLERHVVEGDAADPFEATYAIWNGARILRTLATGDPVISKRAAGAWALTHLPPRWHPVIRAAGRASDGQATDDDRHLLETSMAPFVRMVRRRLPRAGARRTSPRWS